MEIIPLPEKKYNIIYADPPWNKTYIFSRDKKLGKNGYYNTLTVDEISSIDVNKICDKDCILFMWVIDNCILDAKKVIESWGFTYKTIAFTWVKKTYLGKDHFGVGVWTRKNPEIVMLATRGHIKRKSSSIRQLQYHSIARHSEKPPEIRQQIVELCGDLPRIELFARQRAEGWDAWGNEVPTLHSSSNFS